MPKRGGTHDGAPAAKRAPQTTIEKDFDGYAKVLTAKHDRYEVLVKKSRDITILSKRAIFLLHRVNAGNRDATLAETAGKLADIRNILHDVTKTLEGYDPMQYARAYTGGVQEYVEAETFYLYNLEGKVPSLEKLNAQLVFDDEKWDASPELTLVAASLLPKTEFKISPSDYLLGVADLTGEMMRMCINNIGADEGRLPFDIMNCLRDIYDGFKALPPSAYFHKDMNFKVEVMASSLKKVEDACYALKVRGTEFPADKRHLVLASGPGED